MRTLALMAVSASLLLLLSSVSDAYVSPANFLHRLSESSNKYLTTQELWFNQTLDHYSPYDHRRFQQRYYEFLDHFRVPNGPIFLEICGESACNGIVNDYISVLAKKFGAAVVSLEHRYYGKSSPFKSTTTEDLKYLSSKQALFDLAAFRQYYQESLNLKLNRTNVENPWFVFGVSYSGALSAWFRLKFPHLTCGSLASSAVVLAVYNYTEFDRQIGDSAGAECKAVLQETTQLVENQLASNKKAVKALFGAAELEIDGDFLYYLADAAVTAFQYGNPDEVCTPLVEAKKAGEDLVDAYAKYVKEYFGGYVHTYNQKYLKGTSEGSDRLWWFQVCTEVAYFQVAPSNDSVRSSKVDTKYHLDLCKNVFGEGIYPEPQKLCLQMDPKIPGVMHQNRLHLQIMLALTLLLVLSSVSDAYVSPASLFHRLSESSGNYLTTQELWFNQTLDHYSPYDHRRFQQRYYEFLDYFRIPNGPIFLKICGESACNGIANDYISVLAKKFGAAVVSLEHRYYGKSSPFKTTTTEDLKYLSSKQALFDLAAFRQYYQESLNLKLNRTNVENPWFVFGISYPGALSAWFRLKFPHLTCGSLASSAVVLAVYNYTEFDQQIGDSAGAECKAALQETTQLVEKQLASNKKEVKALFGAAELEIDGDFLYFLADSAVMAFQYGNPDELCTPLVEAKKAGEDLVDAYAKYVKKHTSGNVQSYNQKYLKDTSEHGERLWWFQVCTEVAYFQAAPSNDSIRSSKVDIKYHLDLCKNVFGEGVYPEPQRLCLQMVRKIPGVMHQNRLHLQICHPI
ncbi:hypothetical protein Tsubulata_042724 [Turnera subulata]|uniref:Serine protease EDA2 n=1 Tax=Turnera subulata TaxID=218843 RepID=A0A9Q0G8B7_9ROSI|nr:hypothetical protein Tsubulata_042724 [Turnera subulata]